MGLLNRKCSLLGLCLSLILVLQGCSDDVNSDNLFIFSGETISSYLEKTDGYHLFSELTARVTTGSKTDSRVKALLSARGNYTVFAPNDAAVREFVDSVYEQKNYPLDSISDEMARYIVRNAIIDNGTDEAYMTTDFQIGALEKRSLDDRYIMVSFDTINGKTAVIINEKSVIENPDVECSNGYVQGVTRVLQPSNDKLPDLMKQADNMRIFSKLLEVTGLADSLSHVRDEYYEANHAEYGYDLSKRLSVLNPEHRYYGFTAFAEPDSVFEAEWGIEAPVYKQDEFVNWESILAKLKEKCAEAYPEAKGEDMTSNDNPVYQFVAYHLVPARMSWEKMVIHYLEMGYAFNNPNNLTIDCNEYYETMGGLHRLMKITEGRQTDGKRINRHCTYDRDTYDELTVDRPGIKISSDNGKFSINALNGFYYPIDHILTYDDGVPGVVLNDRLRWDFSSLFSEVITNGIRRYPDNGAHPIPRGYCERISWTADSWCVYLPYAGAYSQCNYQADEYNIRGQYDLTFRLPPVPFEGTWQFRICAPCNSGFGMAQFYIGKNKNNLQAIGLPVDLRLSLSNPNIGWQADDPEDEEFNREVDKNMLNHDYMKPPRHDGISRNGAPVTESMRNSETYRANLRVRKIVWTGTIRPDEVMYMRIKSVLTNPFACFLLDYMEWVPKSVFNGVEEEDQW